jgi:type IV pilus assembly protein PilC
MPLFAYKARDKKGKIVDDVIQATNRKEAAAILKSNDLQVLTIKSLDSKASSLFKGKIPVSEKAVFCRFMATMLKSGLPLPEAVDIIRQGSANKKLQKVLFDVSFEVRKGATLSSALSKYKSEFNPVFLTMIKAGEESGTLDKSFEYLAKQLLASYELSQKIKGSLMYPTVILLAMTANAVVMLVFVLPKISEVFLQLNVELPFMTRLILGFGEFVGGNLALSLTVMFSLIFLAFLLLWVRSTREKLFALFVKLPVVKEVVRQLDVARFARTLSTLLKSGVPIMAALEVASDVLTQPKLKTLAKKFGPGVARGESLSEILAEGPQVFPVIVTQTIKAGERTGNLEVVLEEMAQFYESEVDFSLKRATALLEPVLMLVIGIAVGAMVIIMITPIYSIVGGIESTF